MAQNWQSQNSWQGNRGGPPPGQQQQWNQGPPPQQQHWNQGPPQGSSNFGPPGGPPQGNPGNSWGGGPPSQQQQQQWGQQNQQWGQQHQQWGQQPQPQYPCCPEDPNEHFCNTDPNQQPQPGQQPSAMLCLWQQCDATMWMVALCGLLAIIGFGITVGAKGPDNLLGAFDVEDAEGLHQATYWLVIDNEEAWWAETNGTLAPPTTAPPTPLPPYTEIVNGTPIILPRPTMTQAPESSVAPQAQGIAPRRMLQQTNNRTGAPAPRPAPPAIRCRDKQKMFGTFGAVCAEQTLEATAMLMNVSRWVNFRGTLYFLAMIATLTLLAIVVIVNKQKAWLDAGGGPGTQVVVQQQPPYKFHGTPLYYSFRMAWGAVSIMVFFWVVTEMYQYWWFIDYYKARTSGELRSFWEGFDKKFVPATICVTIYLCWPLAHLCLELGLFIVGLLPWFCVKQVYQQLQNPQVDEEKAFDDHSCCIRTNMFYGEFRQAHRLGFSEGQWEMMTGSRVPYCTALDCGGPMPQQGQFMGQQQMRPPQGGNNMGQPMSPVESPKKKKKSKKRHDSSDDESSSDSDGPRRSRSKSRRERSESPHSVHSSQHLQQSGMYRGMPTNTSQNAFMAPPPGGASPTLRQSQSGWGSDTDVRKSSSKKSKKSRDETDSERERRKAKKKEEKALRRSQSAFGEDDVRASMSKKEKKDKKDKKDKKKKKQRDDDDD